MGYKRRPVAQDVQPEWAQGRYASASNDPRLWIWKAKELAFAAQAIWRITEEEVRKAFAGDWEATPVAHVSMMLYGMAVENYLKARLVHSGLGKTPQGRATLKSHNLLDLSARAGIALSDRESELVERLECFIVWAGRYPTSLRVEDMYFRGLVDGGKGQMFGFQSGMHADVEALLARVKIEYDDVV